MPETLLGTRIVRIAVERGQGCEEDRIQVVSSDGMTGFGEGLWCERALRAQPEVLLGRSPFEAEAIYDDVAAAAGETPGGLDIALWDLAGKSLGLPTAAILGKVWQSRVTTLRRVEASSLADVGCRCGVQLTAANLGAALEMARCLERSAPAFWEAPLAEDDLEGYRSLKEQAAIPLAAGGRCGMDMLLRMVQDDLVDIVIPDIARYGLTGLRRLAYSCWLFRVRGAVACSGSDLAMAAALTAAAGFVPVSNALARPEPFIVTPGGREEVFPIPPGPGLGVAVSLDPEVVLEARA